MYSTLRLRSVDVSSAARFRSSSPRIGASDGTAAPPIKPYTTQRASIARTPAFDAACEPPTPTSEWVELWDKANRRYFLSCTTNQKLYLRTEDVQLPPEEDEQEQEEGGASRAPSYGATYGRPTAGGGDDVCEAGGDA